MRHDYTPTDAHTRLAAYLLLGVLVVCIAIVAGVALVMAVTA